MSLYYELELQQGQIALYLDILGFSNAIRSNIDTFDSTKGITVNFVAFQRGVFEHYSIDYQNSKGIRFLFVSDSFFITASSNNANQLISELIYIIWLMYNTGFSIRGGISVGALYNGINIWGPAICNAVDYEKLAENPCIIIPKADFAMLDITSEYAGFFVEAPPEIFHRFTKDNQNSFLYFDFFDYYFKTAINDGRNIIPFLSICSKLVRDQFLLTSDVSIMSKWSFLARHLSSVIEQHAEYIIAKHNDALSKGAEKRYKTPEDYLEMIRDANDFTNT